MNVPRAAIVPRLFLIRAVVLICGLAGLWPGLRAASPADADEKKLAGNASLPDRSVEELAAFVRPSVVVISHFGRTGRADGVGAGFIVSSNGLIATSLHVIGEARPIRVRLDGGREYDVIEIHAWDRKRDLAVLRIAADHLPTLELGDSDSLRQGSPVIAMGNPLGLEFSVVQGVVSAKREFDGFEMIQLAVPIEPGNSGGPLLDRQGRVHGLLNMKSVLTPNLGFATPINALKELLEKPNSMAMNRWLTLGALSARDWTPQFGAHWRQRGGRIQVEGVGEGFGGRSLCLWNHPVPERPFEIRVSVRLDAESGAAGLLFASDGDQKHYGFYPTGGQLRLTRFEGPSVFTWTILNQLQTAYYRTGEWNRLRVRLETGRILCYVNEQLVIESSDAVLGAGKVGLVKFRDTHADFKDFRVGTNLTDSAAQTSPELTQKLRGELLQWAGGSDRELAAALVPHAPVAHPLVLERARELEQQAGKLRQLAASVHSSSVREELVALFAQPEEKVDLFLAALLVSRLDNPELGVEVYQQHLQGMAEDILAHFATDTSEVEKLAALKKYFFVENGFHGSRNEYHDRANSYINEVLDDREGLPITLSVLFIELAHRVGLKTVAGVPLPGHFIAKYVNGDGEEQLIDVFAGEDMSRAQAATLVEEFGSRFTAADLKAANKKEIIIRMLNNLLNTAQRTRRPADALRYLDAILALSPDGVLERGRRAMLRVQLEDPSGAREDIRWLLDRQPPGVDLDGLTELYHSLAP